MKLVKEISFPCANPIGSVTPLHGRNLADCVDAIWNYPLHDIPVNTDNTPSRPFSYGFHNLLVAHYGKTDGRTWNIKRHENQCVPLEYTKKLVLVADYCISCK